MITKKDNRDAIDFGKDPVVSLFRRMFLPTLVTMISIVVLNITDGAFVGHGVGSNSSQRNSHSVDCRFENIGKTHIFSAKMWEIMIITFIIAIIFVRWNFCRDKLFMVNIRPSVKI